jgi:DNA-binding HxlR family transcriptional regulator
MPDNEQIILATLKEGEKRWKDLERVLVKSGKMSKSTLSQNLFKLERDGKIKRFADYSKKPPAVQYALSSFESHLERKVREAVEELRCGFKFFREPTVKEVAFKVGETPEAVRPILYGLAPKIGWREQDKEEAEKEAEEAINLAGWLIWLQKGEQNAELNKMVEEAKQAASNGIVERARKILENCPELAPEAKPASHGPHFFSSAGLEPWPEETERVWMRVFLKEPPSSGTRQHAAWT